MNIMVDWIEASVSPFKEVAILALHCKKVKIIQNAPVYSMYNITLTKESGKQKGLF